MKKEWLYEQKHRMIDHFYFWFGTDDYLNNKEPVLLFKKWVCHSIEWKLFNSYREAEQALKIIKEEENE